MKKIDILLLKAFVGPFIITFFISLFVFIMQFLWKYIDDLVGKGLETSILLELIFHLSVTMVPLVIPLAILLASIITFGNMGEHYELVALKSAGISLLRFMMPLFCIIVLLSGVTFYFSNNILPKANLKYGALLYSVVKKRPAFNIKEGVFYDGIDGFSIKIDEKDPDNITIRNVHIWEQLSGKSGQNLLVASKGQMYAANDSSLIFKLYDGWKYEDMKATKPDKKGNHEHMRTAFKELEMAVDISVFGFEKKDEKLFLRNPKVMSIPQLSEAIDSLNTKEIKYQKDLKTRVKPFYKLIKFDSIEILPLSHQLEQKIVADLYDENVDSLSFDTLKDSLLLTETESIDSVNTIMALLNLPKKHQKTVLSDAKNDAKSVFSYAEQSIKQQATLQKRISKFYIYLYNKFSLSFSCIVLFLIGAPLGAIIRKGGLGMPMVVSIIFFMIFHILTTVGRKLAEEGAMAPFHGTWLPVYVLLPLAIFLTYKAINDSVLFNIDAYRNFFMKIFRRNKALNSKS